MAVRAGLAAVCATAVALAVAVSATAAAAAAAVAAVGLAVFLHEPRPETPSAGHAARIALSSGALLNVDSREIPGRVAGENDVAVIEVFAERNERVMCAVAVENERRSFRGTPEVVLGVVGPDLAARNAGRYGAVVEFIASRTGLYQVSVTADGVLSMDYTLTVERHPPAV